MENPNPLGDLTLEQQFSVKRFNDEIDVMPVDQMRELLRQMLILQMRKDNAMRQMIKGTFFS